MYDVKDRIAKLLALADSTNENEAKAALLKARELMAEHKLRPEECEKKESTKVVVDLVNVTCTKMTDAWAPELSAVIAAHYCCKAYRNHRYNSKKVTIGFAGLEDDFEICKRVFLYAYDCIKSRCKEIAAEHRGYGYDGSEIREMCNAYGFGFSRGLNRAYHKQAEKHQEWGLVMVVPKAVEDATAHHAKPSAYGKAKTDGWHHKYMAAGFEDGEKFDPTHRLEKSGAGVPAITG